MGVVHTVYYTDPFCPWSWALEPALRRLVYELGEELQIEYVMAGMRRSLDDPGQLAVQALEAAEQSGMPADARGWLVDPPSSSHPACMAVLAAAEQGDPGPYLRRLREGLFCRRRKLDSADALAAEARETPGLGVERFRIDLGSHAILEGFGGHLQRAQTAGRGQEDRTDGRIKLPSLEFRGTDGSVHGVYGYSGYEQLLEAARAAGAGVSQRAALSVEQALARFGAMSTAEVAAVCHLPGPRAPAELWALAAQWRVSAERAGPGALWRLT